jgi:predicted transcriptional regulator
VKLSVQSFRLLRKHFPVIAGLILLISSCMIVTPFTRNTESGAIVSAQDSGSGSSTVITTTTSSPQSPTVSLFLNSFSQTSSGGLGSVDFASSSQPYYATSSLPPVSTTVPCLLLNLSKRRKKRRARSEIYVDILELMKERGPMTPFEIALYARLNHKRTKECITFLNLCNYLQKTSETDGRTSYVLTREGLKFLERAEAFFNDHVTSEISNHA